MLDTWERRWHPERVLALSGRSFHALHYGLLFGLPIVTIGLAVLIDARRTSHARGSQNLDTKLRTAIGLGSPKPNAPRAPVDTRARLVRAAALGSLLAGLVHATVATEHFQEYWLFGIFFVLAAAFQIAWGSLVVRRQASAVLKLGVAVNAATIALYIASRTTGLPLGPDAGTAEAWSVAGVVSLVAELMVVGAGARAARA